MDNASKEIHRCTYHMKIARRVTGLATLVTFSAFIYFQK